MTIMYFDFETSGLDPKRHAILQAAWIIEKDGKIVAEKCFDVLPEEYADLCLGALAVNNFTLERIRAGKPLSYVMCSMVQDLRSAMSGASLVTLCGHNVHFDIGFLVEAADKTRENVRNHVSLSGALDTCAIARFYSHLELIKVRNHKLTTLAEYFSIAINAHDALGDVKATREVLRNLIAMYPTGKEFFDRKVSREIIEPAVFNFTDSSFVTKTGIRYVTDDFGLTYRKETVE
jgi:DNA polymerase-3 subunit epsilon